MSTPLSCRTAAPVAARVRLATGTGLVAAGAGLGTVVTDVGGRNTGELALDVSLSQHRVTPLVDVAQAVNTALGPVMGPALVVVAAAVGFLVHRRGAAVFLAATMFLWLAASAFKPLFARPRPPAAAVHALVTETGPDSFPSGHTALALAIVAGAFLAFRSTGRPGRLVLASGVPVGIGVALSRLYLGVHYLGDVVGSFLFVGGLAVLLSALLPVHRDRLP